MGQFVTKNWWFNAFVLTYLYSAGNRVDDKSQNLIEEKRPCKPKLRSRESEKPVNHFEPVIDFSKTTNWFNGVPFDRNMIKTPHKLRKDNSNLKIIKKTEIIDNTPKPFRTGSRKKLRIKSKKPNMGSSQVNFYPGSKDYFYKPELFSQALQDVENGDIGSQLKPDGDVKMSQIDQDSTSLSNITKPKQTKTIYLQKKNMKHIEAMNEEGTRNTYINDQFTDDAKSWYGTEPIVPKKKKKRKKKLRNRDEPESAQPVMTQHNKSKFEMNWDEDTLEIRPHGKSTIDEWD